MTPTRDAILDIIAEEARIDREKLLPDATLISLDIASLDVVSVLFAIEDRFGFEVPPEDIRPDATLAAFVDLIMARAAAA